MLFRQLFDAQSATYTYLLADQRTRDAVLIDPVFEQFRRDAALIRELRLTLRYTLDTHVHADHVTAAWLFKTSLGSLIALSRAAGAEGVDILLDDGDAVGFGNCALEVRATPGHTDACVTYVTADRGMAFTGDALLIRGAGRTDFQQGNASILFRSIMEKIFTLPDDCILYPAHDYAGRTSSTVGEEKAHNPRVGGGANERDFVGYMRNLGLAHPKQMDQALPANLKCGRPRAPEVLDPGWGPAVLTYAGVLEIDPIWVAEHRDAVTVLDVRESDELTGHEGRIVGALHLPLDQLRERAREVPASRPVVTVCRSGRRSAQATLILKQAGVHDCANLAGGMLCWRSLGLPVERE
ncbi:MAG TPA: MBL fold metallo-hydrolase [Polyangiaceae bacterium]|jgi:glyoxylase-like metal-dependent hydrolase (beta-lactamase superfamily II)/rhodanese-related sulfurtransferase